MCPRARVVALALCFSGCGGHRGEPAGTPAPAEQLVSPLTEPELVAAVEASFQLTLDTTLPPPWHGHGATLATGDAACPPVAAGEPYGQYIAGAGQVGAGSSYSAACDTGGKSYDGYMYWETASDAASGARALFGDTVVGTDEAVDYEFDGEGSDDVAVTGSGADYESDLDATVTGASMATGLVGPGGYRTDLYLSYSTGDSPSFEAHGDVLLFDDLLQERFDSVNVDLSFEKTASSVEDCTDEPSGTISFRDADANWYDVVFAPLYHSNLDYEDELSACDGCGTVYWQGYQQGQVCLDFDFLWSALQPPDPTDFTL